MANWADRAGSSGTLRLTATGATARILTLNGACPPDKISEISDPGKFYDSVRKAKLNGQDMFEPTPVEQFFYSQSGNTANWHFTLQLKHAEATP